MQKFKELFDELKLIFSGRNSLLDALLPLLIFVLANALFGSQIAIWAALGASLIFTVLRLVKHQPAKYALGGMGTTLLAAGLAFLSGRAETYFLPSLVNGAVMVILLLVSLIVKRPAVAFTSYLTRRWPLDWYWHPRIRPAYSQVTAIWVIYSLAKLLIQLILFQRGAVDSLAMFNLVSGWPALIVLLIASYLYGLYRLKKLQGPSVEEFKQKMPPPWQGQQRGF
jgi:prepilin signal peptidase PulO-like enzyme (type II secretory pathway)